VSVGGGRKGVSTVPYKWAAYAAALWHTTITNPCGPASSAGAQAPAPQPGGGGPAAAAAAACGWHAIARCSSRGRRGKQCQPWHAGRRRGSRSH